MSAFCEKFFYCGRILDKTNFLKAKNKSGFDVLNYYSRLSKVFSISDYIKIIILKNTV